MFSSLFPNASSSKKTSGSQKSSLAPNGSYRDAILGSVGMIFIFVLLAGVLWYINRVIRKLDDKVTHMKEEWEQYSEKLQSDVVRSQTMALNALQNQLDENLKQQAMSAMAMRSSLKQQPLKKKTLEEPTPNPFTSHPAPKPSEEPVPQFREEEASVVFELHSLPAKPTQSSGTIVEIEDEDTTSETEEIQEVVCEGDTCTFTQAKQERHVRFEDEETD